MPLHKYPPRLWDALKLKKGIFARLPQHYLKALQNTPPPTPVHWKPLGVKYRANPKTGHRERVQDIPIPVYYPPESQDGLWGGEGWIRGYRYANNDKMSTRVKKTWKPQLFKRELYSEILDQKFSVTVTARALDLIDAAYGFDFYILKQFEIPEEEAEWMGLSLEEAVEKQRLLERKDPEPLYQRCVDSLVRELAIQKLTEPQLVKKD
ncbi:39S ribosomal protein L28, mitochondrial isoform X2 [Electrophorus electricus]|uniref:39S ribosomal protein L28, mitochondrial isoform X2 n=1 Tax=Electrophorus electricus TaxID=8005 RepID=UPI000F0A154A|nr:39S ribosomal protein L28, mitochondrial isoform X2 [Electrophorus electricus]